MGKGARVKRERKATASELTDDIMSASEYEQAAKMISELVGQWLNLYYPNPDPRCYPLYWVVQVDLEGKIVNIFNFALSAEWGYTLHLSSFDVGDGGRRRVMQAGGEILERFGLPTTARQMPVHLLDALERDIMGQAKADLS